MWTQNERGSLMSRVKKVFAGGNTTQGFYSFYHNIFDDDANRVFILKGGPGTGKSSFMKKIAQQLLILGYDIEEFYCSSDAQSLDGIVVPKLKVAIVDGTAPHVMDPKYPGCVEEIINLGQYWDASNLEAERLEIIRLTKANSACYPRAYRYLRAAKCIYEDIQDITKNAMDFGKINRITTNLIQEILGDYTSSLAVGKIRSLFASGITPQGPVNELHSIVENCTRKYILKGEPGTGKSTMITKIAQRAMECGLSSEAYHCPIAPESIEHLVIPKLNVAIISSYPPHIYEADHAIVINLNDCLCQAKRTAFQPTLHKNHILFEELLDLAFEQLRKAKVIHDQLEDKFTPHMDFEKINRQNDAVLKKILSYA